MLAKKINTHRRGRRLEDLGRTQATLKNG